MGLSLIIIFLVALCLSAAEHVSRAKSSSLRLTQKLTSATSSSRGGFNRLILNAQREGRDSLRRNEELQQHQPSLVENFISTTRLSSESLNVKSWKLFFVAALLTVTSLASFNLLTGLIADASIASGFKGNPANLLILDLRNGYTATQVTELLSAWGHSGRQLYLAIEAIDITAYHTGYRAAFLVLVNRIAEAFCDLFPRLAFLRKLAMLPIVLALIDFSEDVGQIALTTLYDVTNGAAAQSYWWPALVQISSTINVLKWSTVRAGSIAVGVMVFMIAVSYVFSLVLSMSQQLKGEKRAN